MEARRAALQLRPILSGGLTKEIIKIHVSHVKSPGFQNEKEIGSALEILRKEALNFMEGY